MNFVLRQKKKKKNKYISSNTFKNYYMCDAFF